MESTSKNVVNLGSGATFKDLLKMNEDELLRSTNLIEICLPNSYAIEGDGANIRDINGERCFGCLNCLSDSEIAFITPQFVPTLKEAGNTPLTSICKEHFLGSYPKRPISMNRFSRHTETDETTITNPISALFLWRLSVSPDRTFFCCSPSWEISLPTTGPNDQREGHIDVVVLSFSTKKICVLEGKSTLDNLLRDRLRDQWNRYYGSLKQAADELGYELFFFYLIGGEELGLYPEAGDIPQHPRRREFYQFISENDKRFISLESLRALRARQLSIDPAWNWEEWFYKLYGTKDFIGILSGGIVIKRDEQFRLEKAPWV